MSITSKSPTPRQNPPNPTHRVRRSSQPTLAPVSGEKTLRSLGHGSPDQAPWRDLLGTSNCRFVDSLFTGRADTRDAR